MPRNAPRRATHLAEEVASDLHGTVEQRQNAVVVTVPLGGTRHLDVLIGETEPRGFIVYDDRRVLIHHTRPSLAELRLASHAYRHQRPSASHPDSPSFSYPDLW